MAVYRWQACRYNRGSRRTLKSRVHSKPKKNLNNFGNTVPGSVVWEYTSSYISYIEALPLDWSDIVAGYSGMSPTLYSCFNCKLV